MGEGPGKGGGEDLAEVTGDSEEMTERPATDSGSGTRLAIPAVDKVRVVPSKELIVGEGGGKGRNSWGISVIGGPGIDSAVTTGSGTGISSPARGRGAACTSCSAGIGTTTATGSPMTRSTSCGTAGSIGSGTAT